MSEEIKAHQIASIGGTRSDDGKFGLIKFVREKPTTSGETDMWMAVPIALLPYLATVAVRQIPQPKDGATIDYPYVLDAKEVVFGKGAKGQLVLSLTIENGATLSYELDLGQAHALIVGMQTALGSPDLGQPKGSKPN